MADFELTKVTEDGLAGEVATMSPDGRLVAYVKAEGQKTGLYVKQLATGSEVTVVVPGDEFYWLGACFTPDGNYLYYSRQDPENGGNANLYRVPSLGGNAVKVVSDVASGPSFSPDRKRMVYTRVIQQTGEDQLLMANLLGKDEHAILRRGHNDGFAGNPAWSSDGNLIAQDTYTDLNNSLRTILFLTPDGKVIKAMDSALRIGS
jgi:Tol biopolymer transport system component